MVTIEYLYKLFLKSTGVCTDTRNITKNSMFFALKGGSFNGNLYAEEALEKGARFAIVDEDVSEDEEIFKVNDVLKTLQDLAHYHRTKFTCPVLGITGTNGKTTTKELLYTVLNAQFKTYATEGNLNNHIGVPLTLLSIPISAEMVIVEMGANKPGDIKELSEIAAPDYGLITNVGKAHLEGFGSFEGVKKTKGELFGFISSSNGKIFLNTTNQELVEMAKGLKAEQKVAYLGEDSQVKSQLISQTPFVNLVIDGFGEVSTKIVGGYNYENISAAISVGDYFKIPMAKITDAISQYESTNNRSQIIKKGGNSILLDAYNANPTSMASALKNFINIQAANKVVILGDMFELGNVSDVEHRTVVELVLNLGLSKAVFCGEEFYKQKNDELGFVFLKSLEQIKSWLEENPIHDSFILLKGSRGMKLETLVDSLG